MAPNGTLAFYDATIEGSTKRTKLSVSIKKIPRANTKVWLEKPNKVWLEKDWLDYILGARYVGYLYGFARSSGNHRI